MNIKYDTSWDHRGGIGKYSEEIAKRLPGVKFFSINGNPASPIFALKLTYMMLKDRKCFFILPGYIPPLFIKDRFFFTIHDLNHLDLPNNSSLMKRLFYKFVIKRGCYNAKVILTVSEFSKGRIVKWSGVQPNKVVVVGNGVDQKFKPRTQNFSQSNLRESYFFCVSNRKSHKNEKKIIEAFIASNIDKKIKLVMTGKINDELKELIVTNHAEDRVVFTGFLSEEELIEWYQFSLALVFPSLYEGFGIPVLEAMACGVPVITSNTTALPEIAGDAALLVDPEDVSQLRLAIEKITTDDFLREQLIKKGLSRSKEFTWDATARKIKDKLNEIGIKD
ncbi:glycosyltransferase family 4 protein [Serratia fonticola]|uniref:glycosyltransferase family 4 protein n=1 Tax=Serratia fonticola TaxID=47917 RepID=UPI0015C66DEE|nr:glycosyltransferase family 1 protein [Serratia fonticola]MBC3380904.1 glycosyltransferase family 4 protein [Serratia fonticola]NYA40103.1 glycosyltransferase family 4 protein [Serratia fonticola]